MTSEPVDDVPAPAALPQDGVVDLPPSSVPGVSRVCPYLAGGDGSWRSAQPARSHVCAAVQPPTPLAASKQRQLCLTSAHATCATFTAAEALVSPRAAGAFDADLWPASRPRVVTLEPVRSGISGITSPQARTGGQAVLVGLMVVAFLVLAIARTSSPSSPSTPTPAASSSAVAGVSASPTVGPSLTPAGSSPSPAAPSPMATSSPGASAAAGTTYKVKRRDTLGSIALKFGVTVKALRKANGLTKSSVIRPGQVLAIPAP